MSNPLENVARIDYDGFDGARTIVFNRNRITEAEAIRMVNAGEYCPYLLDIPTKQFEGLFQDKDVNWTPPEWMKEGSAASRSQEDIPAVRFVEGGPEPRATHRNCIKRGLTVDIVLKADQPTGKLTRGVVKDILTNTHEHHRGIKVRLSDGQVGRVQYIIGETSQEKEGGK